MEKCRKHGHYVCPHCIEKPKEYDCRIQKKPLEPIKYITFGAARKYY